MAAAHHRCPQRPSSPPPLGSVMIRSPMITRLSWEAATNTLSRLLRGEPAHTCSRLPGAKELRRLPPATEAALKTRLHIVRSHTDGDGDTEALQKLWATAYCPEHEHRCAQQTMQHQALFQARKLKMNFTELSAEHAALLLGTLALEASDCFVDLGCSAGRLVHAAAHCSAVRSAVGIDLSPLRTRSTVEMGQG